MTLSNRHSVLIAGIGGASLGTELLKCVAQAGCYDIFGCDISPHAFGHYDPQFAETFCPDREDYAQDILNYCRTKGIEYIIPGGEEPVRLLSAASTSFAKQGITILQNSSQLVDVFTDKERTFAFLQEMGFSTPKTMTISSLDYDGEIPVPCIVKPATGTGGSASVFFAESCEEAKQFVNSIVMGGKKAVVQEYLPHDEGEYSIGVLSLPDKTVVSSIAYKRLFSNKLSIHFQCRNAIIASPYGQGFFEDFKEIRQQGEAIAAKSGSVGPLNIQGRMVEGEFVPFEVNPRFSGSVYMRALAGVNEPHLLLQAVINGEVPDCPLIRPGLCVRSLSERFVPHDKRDS